MNLPLIKPFSLLVAILLFSGCSLKRVNKLSDQTYDHNHNLKLDVFSPRKANMPKKILVFIHGGNWVNGKKSLYRFFGKGLARKDAVGVMISYRLSPRTDIAGMADDVALAVKWVKENAASFNGDSSNIFISGHSAGGHLAAMAALDDRYFEKLSMRNPIKGVILIDAYGLDVYSYLSRSTNKRDTMYKRIFSYDPTNWKTYSPYYYLGKNKPGFIQFVGGKTNTIIKEMNDAFYKELKKFQPNAQLIVVKRKRHVPMMFHLYNSRAKTYKDIVSFMNSM